MNQKITLFQVKDRLLRALHLLTHDNAADAETTLTALLIDVEATLQRESQDFNEAEQALVRESKPIDAVVAYRKRTDATLRAAVDALDRFRGFSVRNGEKS